MPCSGLLKFFGRPRVCREVFAAAVIASSASLAHATASAPTAAQPTENVVNIYSSRHYDADEKIHKMFTEATGIKIQHVHIKDAPQMIERLKAEGASSKADVIITVDVGNLWRAEQAGLLQSVEIPESKDLIADSLRHPEGKWFAITQRARVIAFNNKKHRASEFGSYAALIDPKFKGKVLVRSSTHVYSQSLIASMIQHRGAAEAQKWVNGISANLARKPQGGDTDQIRAIAAGVGDLAIVNSYYVARLLQSKKPEDVELMKNISFAFPEQDTIGTHVNISGAAVGAHAPHRANAIRFISFMLSNPVQELYAEENGEYPVTKSAKMTEVLRGFGKFKADTTNLTVIGKNMPESVRMTDMSDWR